MNRLGKRLTFSLLLMSTLATGSYAQRVTDKLDRGLVAVKTTQGVFCSWRIQADEYYDVKYNIYRDGVKLNAEPLEVSNFTDKSGTASSKYAVEAVERGVTRAKSAEVTPWAQNYLEVKMDHGSLASTYVPNDASVADVDGDGQVEILLKFNNASDGANGYKPEGYKGEYAIMEVYKLNGKKLWWIELGPNMTDFQNNENNIVAYDWDQDGKAEALMRAADGTVIHKADGTTVVIGDKSKNYRPAGGMSGQFFIHEGAEYLLYMNGATGDIYQQMEYPLKRLEAGETSLESAWGDGYGHRSTKHFFGAPYLDGKHPSIFLARGIYTQHKMVAFDVDPASHRLIERWRWNSKQSGSPWFGQGYHNFGIADVDMDGRDEIVFGSMVIDDNGHGLSTTGLGHGDSQHCGDFDPYTPGQEIFACNEDNPGNNFRDATTSKIYYRYTAGDDDGRCLMGNFVDEIPGCQGVSSRDPNLISSVAHAPAKGYDKGSFSITQNFRIYWDGDLCDESFDYSNGKNSAGAIFKANKGMIAKLDGSLTNNDTKGTPDIQADILGDWREEVIMRTKDNNIRIYTTDIETPWRNYSLWYDHQYRNSVVWQMCGYNQTPHVSYFLGEKEGITVAPPPLTVYGRTEVANGATISSAHNDKHLLLDENGDMTVAVADGARPYIVTDNAPTWTQGHDDNDNITTTSYTHTLTGGAFTGDMRLVKQGEGTLVLPAVTETYTGPTQVWNGRLSFDGVLQNSHLWLNRHTTLLTDGGRFLQGIQADYNARIAIGKPAAAGTVETTDLNLGFGAVVEFDLFGDGQKADVVKASSLTIGTIDWTNGPKYSAPVFRFVSHPADGQQNLPDGRYLIGEIDAVKGNLSDIVVEGMGKHKTKLVLDGTKLYLDVASYEAGNVTWTGSENGNWDVDNSANFASDGSAEQKPFVPGDVVTFDDNAKTTDITVVGNVAPGAIHFANETKDFTLSGDSITGNPRLTKTGAGNVTIKNVNHIGSTTISGGRLTVTSVANAIGDDYGALGGVNAPVELTNGGTLAVSASATLGQKLSVGQGGGTLEVPQNVELKMDGGLLKSGNTAMAVLTKSGKGTLTLSTGNRISRLVIKEGAVNSNEENNVIALPQTVEFQGGSLYDCNNMYSSSTNSAAFVVEEGYAGSIYLDPRCNYKGKLTGSGTFTVYAAGPRNYLQGNWSEFTGTLVAGQSKRSTYDPSFDWDNSYGLPKGTLSINNGTTFNASKALKLGGLAGQGKLNCSDVTVGLNDIDVAFTGSFNNTTLTKTGKGDFVVSTALSGLKSVTVNDGLMSLAPKSYTVDLTGGKTVTVNSGATLRGRGKLAAVVVNDGGVIKPGVYDKSNSYRDIATGGNLTVNQGGVAEFNIVNGKNTAGARTYLTVGGKLSMNGIVNVTADPGYTPAEGDVATLWTAGSFTGKPVIGTLPALPEGLVWDTSALSQAEGVIKVVSAAGITTLTGNAVVECKVYDLSGMLVTSFTTVRSQLLDAMRNRVAGSQTYIVRMRNANASEQIKINLR